ncbi:MAG: recombinase family protein [Bacteroidales bacterium]|nr:recombinase family protein [Bacteroidales bacterium]
MSRRKPAPVAPVKPTTIRCAIYTRKSTEEGLEQEYNSLDAQRDAGENYIKSQASEGWVALAEQYDDGGFTGGNMDRPALKRLMADIEAGKIDAVVVYKVDRLSRSLLDFAKMMQAFEKHNVSFISVTQSLNTSNSMGRLMLNVLLSFAQFEREVTGERIRDKIAATRRKGKWTGGWPILGYDVDPVTHKLIVNAVESGRVKTIFKLYLERGSMMPVVEELAKRGWRNKQWQTRKAGVRGGMVFTRTSLYKLLTNVVYIGKVKYKKEVHDGEHEGIIDPAVWQQVQAQLERNGRAGGAPINNKYGAMLKGLIRCVPCKCAMSPSIATRRKTKRYRYYVCQVAQKTGWKTCPSKSIPAGQIEELVVKQLKKVGKDPLLLREVLAAAHEQDAVRKTELEAERRGLEREIRQWNNEMKGIAALAGKTEDSSLLTARLAELQECIPKAEGRIQQIDELLKAIRQQTIDEADAKLAVSLFDPVWGTLTNHEQTRIVQLLVEQVGYDGSTGKVAITFRASGIKALAQQR